MAERTYTSIDKTTWGPGPWRDEPDKIQWIDEATGLDCLAVRHPRSGHWCGYVGVPPDHPAHGVDCDHVRVGDDDWPDVHGGLTFASACQEGGDESTSVCHVPGPGRPADVWWLGFDCAHLGDQSPAHRRFGAPSRGETYKTLSYVREQACLLAAQLARVERMGSTADGGTR